MTTKTDASFNGQIFRKDYKQVIASNRHLASIKAIKTELEVELMPGQVMARDTGDGLFKKYSAVSGGSYDSVCVLLDHLTEGEATGTSIMKAIFGGEVYNSALIDFDSNAQDDMGAKVITDALGDSIVKF